MSPVERFVQFEFRTSCYHFFLMVQIVSQHLVKAKYFWLSIYYSKHYYRECLLKLRVFVEVVKKNMGIYIFSCLYYYSYTFSVTLVSKICYSFDSFFLNQVCNLFDQLSLVYLIRYLGNYYLALSITHLFDFSLGSLSDFSSSCPVCLIHERFSIYHGSCRKIRSLDVLHKVFYRCFIIVYELYNGIHYLRKVVRRYGRSHPYCYPV